MSKVVLVMKLDEFPKDCSNCPLQVENEFSWRSFCAGAGEYHHEIDGDDWTVRPHWCPLIPEPNRREHGDAVEFTEGEPLTDELAERLIDFGYNECLDEIEIAAEGKHETD